MSIFLLDVYALYVLSLGSFHSGVCSKTIEIYLEVPNIEVYKKKKTSWGRVL
jgi:hypothetical protein